MAADPAIQHLLRRAGFGASPAELAYYTQLGFNGSVDVLTYYDQAPDDVDTHIGQSEYVGVTARNGPFSPNTLINDSRQRWLFRMVHSQRPLQEKMTLFWHNYFATAYSKVSGATNAVQAARMMAAKPDEDAAGQKGQIELLREHALGNFGDLLVAVAQDPAMLYWLDGVTNTKDRPQENFARELMELFSMGVGFYTESDVYAGARVFSGWNLSRSGAAQEPTTKFSFSYQSRQHETSAKTFSFPIYPDGNPTIPARSAADGMQDGLDLINAVATHPETARRLARKLYAFFISEFDEPDEGFIEQVADRYLRSGLDIREVVRFLLLSREFGDAATPFTRYSWPVEFVVRSIKEVGWSGFSVNETLNPLANMGQQLFEPPDVAGWSLGAAWFATATTLARMNFAASLANNQKFNLRDSARTAKSSPATLLTYLLERLPTATLEQDTSTDLLSYVTATGAWTGSDQQLLTKTAGLVHLIAGSSEYQFV